MTVLEVAVIEDHTDLIKEQIPHQVLKLLLTTLYIYEQEKCILSNNLISTKFIIYVAYFHNLIFVKENSCCGFVSQGHVFSKLNM